MKILYFGGGLGNQIFEYAFYLYIKDRFPNENIYGVYNKKRLSEHYGLEIHKWFDVNLPSSPWFVNAITAIGYFVKKVFKNDSFMDLDSRNFLNERALILNAYKYNKKYIPTHNWINFCIEEESLSTENREILHKIRASNSIFIHIRRGDFLSEKNKALYANICTLNYYKKALQHIQEMRLNATYYIFSDDMGWTKRNLPLDNAFYIDWNINENSPLDLYLMSNCKGAIMANSTFSYWGALLGIKKNIVIYPRKWINSPLGIPDIFMEHWIPF